MRKFGNSTPASEQLICLPSFLCEDQTYFLSVRKTDSSMYSATQSLTISVYPGDLGVQRGTLRWFLSLHSPTYRIMLSQKNSPGDDDEVAKGMSLDVTLQLESLPVATLSTSVEGHKEKLANLSPPRTPITGNLSTIGPGKIIEPSYEPTNDSPESFTPSIDITSQVKANENFNKLPPLPLGLSTGIMKGRLDTRKKIKGALLSEKEMIALTKSWEPYRSIGKSLAGSDTSMGITCGAAAYYMWALADEK